MEVKGRGAVSVCSSHICCMQTQTIHVYGLRSLCFRAAPAINLHTDGQVPLHYINHHSFSRPIRRIYSFICFLGPKRPNLPEPGPVGSFFLLKGSSSFPLLPCAAYRVISLTLLNSSLKLLFKCCRYPE